MMPLTALRPASTALAELGTTVITSAAAQSIETEPESAGWVGVGLLKVSLVVPLSFTKSCRAEPPVVADESAELPDAI